jgi:hypothetical protein
VAVGGARTKEGANAYCAFFTSGHLDSDNGWNAWSDDIDSVQRALHRGHLERVAGQSFELGVVNRNPSG